MIGERYAVAARPAVKPAIRTRGRRESLRTRLAGRHAIAGRARLAESLGQSLVVQLMLVMSLVVFAALIYLNQASHASVLQYSITYLRQDQSVLRQQNAQLNASQTELTSPARVETAASQLHMAKPASGNTIWIQVPVPKVQVVKPITADVSAAQEQSSPRAWLDRAANFVKSSL
jgi:cell division protein FtsL